MPESRSRIQRFNTRSPRLCSVHGNKTTLSRYRGRHLGRLGCNQAFQNTTCCVGMAQSYQAKRPSREKEHGVSALTSQPKAEPITLQPIRTVKSRPHLNLGAALSRQMNGSGLGLVLNRSLPVCLRRSPEQAEREKQNDGKCTGFENSIR